MQTYFLVGAGGTGTHLLPAMLAYLRNHHELAGTEYQVVIADGDIFEPKNAVRQIFLDGAVTVNKADAMLMMYPGHPLVSVSRYIGKADIEQMVMDGDVVIICADNYSVRALIADHVRTLDNAVVINGGNEVSDGITQLWVREGGENLTPPITYGHPEVRYIEETDRSGLDCIALAKLPGGEQTMLANMQCAVLMLQELQRWHSGAFRTGWTETNYDNITGIVERIDMRERRNWAR